MYENFLSDAHSEMEKNVKSAPNTGVFNWHWDIPIPAIALAQAKILEVFGDAAQWREPVPAADMYFSHGQYYGDGLQHIIEELKEKPTSNRALYSLLAQKDISKSGDSPIPSFLTFQCSIEKSILYCTATFRALEVSSFLRINLEEIRQNLVEIYAAFPAIENVMLHIFAFHAYVGAPPVSALRRPKIDVTSEPKLLRLMQRGELNELDSLLGGLAKSTTVISSTRLNVLLGILQMEDAGLHTDIEVRRSLLETQLKHAIQACNDLEASRKQASRGTASQSKIDVFKAAVTKLQETLST